MPKDSILDEILNKEKDSISITEENGILQPVMEELDMISDDNIKSFVKSILIRADSFWTIPSSFSGKYHPSDEHNQGGNLLHTKRVVRAASVISDSYSFIVSYIILILFISAPTGTLPVDVLIKSAPASIQI